MVSVMLPGPPYPRLHFTAGRAIVRRSSLGIAAPGSSRALACVAARR
jgi:hypothetical protein